MTKYELPMTTARVEDSARPPSRRSLFRRTAKRALIALPVVLVISWLVVHHRPSWYRPPVLNEEGLGRAQRDAIAAADDFGDRLVIRRAFSVTLVDGRVNEWLAALPEAWPESKELLPPELGEPAVHFAAGRLQVGVKLDRRELQSIVSFDLLPTVSADGRTLNFRLDAIRSGAMPIPVSLMERWLKPIITENVADNAPAPADALFALPNRFVWPNGERAFRIKNLTLSDGQLQIDIEAL